MGDDKSQGVLNKEWSLPFDEGHAHTLGFSRQRVSLAAARRTVNPRFSCTFTLSRSLALATALLPALDSRSSCGGLAPKGSMNYSGVGENV